MPNKELPMDTVKFNAKLDKIFNLKESIQPQMTDDGDSIESFRNCIKTRLRGTKNSNGKAIVEAPIDAPYPDSKMVTQSVGVQNSPEDILNKLSELLGVSRETIVTTPKPYPTGETGVFVKVDHAKHSDPNHISHGSGIPKTSSENIGDIWPTQGGFVFKSHNNPWLANKLATVKFNGQTNPVQSDVAVMDERENPISVSTIKSQVMNFGPQALSQIIAKLNPEMNKVDDNGQPSSEYNQFVDSIKQDGLGLILKSSASAGGVKVGPTGGPEKASSPTPAPGVDKKEPGQELANL
jgi:hypothetical protein